KELKIDEPTLKAGLDQLISKYPDIGRTLFDPTGQLRATHRIFVNGNMVEKNEMGCQVAENDVIDILTAITGG
ncbi:MAG TPA: MoaD/ThiS family protein, partial [Myxococcales bacterium]|nr:MoaD/ThiS family protein [Myxococcales bacterium]